MGDNQGFDNFLALAQLGTSTFLANQAVTSSTPSTLTLNAQGLPIVATGGGGAAYLPQQSGFSWLLIAGVLLVVILLFSRH